jgi:hypothetical protein
VVVVLLLVHPHAHNSRCCEFCARQGLMAMAAKANAARANHAALDEQFSIANPNQLMNETLGSIIVDSYM